MRPANIVVIVEDGAFEIALKRFVRAYQRAGLKREIAKHQEYARPGVRRRKKQLRARARIRKQLARTQPK